MYEFGWWTVFDDLKLGDVSWFHIFWSGSDTEIWVAQFWVRHRQVFPCLMPFNDHKENVILSKDTMSCSIDIAIL